LAEIGSEARQVQELVERLKRARFEVFFFGNGLTCSRGSHMNVAAILALARDLNMGQRFTAIPLRNLGNETGADHHSYSWRFSLRICTSTVTRASWARCESETVPSPAVSNA